MKDFEHCLGGVTRQMEASARRASATPPRAVARLRSHCGDAGHGVLITTKHVIARSIDKKRGRLAG
jgi:hypothetical protein